MIRQTLTVVLLWPVLKAQEECHCDCELTVLGPGLLRPASDGCRFPFARWTLIGDRETRLSLKVLNLGPGTVLLVFDGGGKGSPLLLDSRVPGRFSGKDLRSTGRQLHLEAHANSSSGRLPSEGAAAPLHSTVLAYDLLETVPAAAEESSSDVITTLLGICGFTGGMAAALGCLYICCLRPRGDKSTPESPVCSRHASTHCDTAGLGLHRSHHRSADSSLADPDPTIVSSSIPMLELRPTGLRILPPHLRDTKEAGTQLRSPALLLRHVRPMSADGEGNRMESCSSSGRGESPISGFGASLPVGDWDDYDFNAQEPAFLTAYRMSTPPILTDEIKATSVRF